MSDSSPPSSASRIVGAVLNGRYRIERLLGEGGVGAVYAATHIPSGSQVAVKVLHPEFQHSGEVVSRFFDEAAITSRLVHPGVVQVYEATRAEDGTPFLAMELLVGRPLSAALEISGAVPPAFAAVVLQRAMEALDFAHGHGIVHRDLKPDNLFVINAPDGSPSLKIVDFGIAKVMDVAGGMGTRTRTGALLGTPAYMSPEQLVNSKAVDPRSDLWSMAVILFEMLTDHDPFPSENPMEMIHLILNSSAAPISRFRPDLAPLQPFFDRALARKVGDRFQSASEMAQVFLDFVRHLTAGGPPPALPPIAEPAPQAPPLAPAAPADPFASTSPIAPLSPFAEPHFSQGPASSAAPPSQHLGPASQHLGPPSQHLGPPSQHLGPASQPAGPASQPFAPAPQPLPVPPSLVGDEATNQGEGVNRVVVVLLVLALVLLVLGCVGAWLLLV